MLILLLLILHTVKSQPKDNAEFAELSKILSQKFSNEFAFSVLIERCGMEVFTGIMVTQIIEEQFQ